MKNTKIFKFIPIILAVLLAAGAFSACSKESESTQTTTTATTSAAEVLAAGSDVTVDENATATITLNGSSATVKGEGVKVDGSTVLITAGGTFSINPMTDGVPQDITLVRGIRVGDVAHQAEIERTFLEALLDRSKD